MLSNMLNKVGHIDKKEKILPPRSYGWLDPEMINFPPMAPILLKLELWLLNTLSSKVLNLILETKHFSGVFLISL